MLVRRSPGGCNAIDNGFSWLQIICRCEGLNSEAAAINSDIILLFPLSRHAQYALGRATDPGRGNRGCDGGYLD